MRFFVHILLTSRTVCFTKAQYATLNLSRLMSLEACMLYAEKTPAKENKNINRNASDVELGTQRSMTRKYTTQSNADAKYS